MRVLLVIGDERTDIDLFAEFCRKLFVNLFQGDVNKVWVSVDVVFFVQKLIFLLEFFHFCLIVVFLMLLSTFLLFWIRPIAVDADNSLKVL